MTDYKSKNDEAHRIIYEFFEAFEVRDMPSGNRYDYFMLRSEGKDRFGVWAGTRQYDALLAMYNFLHDGTAFHDPVMAGDGEQSE